MSSIVMPIMFIINIRGVKIIIMFKVWGSGFEVQIMIMF